MQFGLLDDEPKKKAVRKSDRQHLIEFQKGKCWKCKRSFKQMGVRKIVHHKNLNPKDNRITNLVLVCPNCHDKIHQKEKKVRVKTTDALGFTDYKVVKKGTRKKSTTKKKRVPAERDIFGNVARWKYVTVKPKKKTAKKKTTTRKTKKKVTKKPKRKVKKTTKKKKTTAKRKTPKRTKTKKRTTKKKTTKKTKRRRKK